jgi:GNAT superfamily N-acetyltransferase
MTNKEILHIALNQQAADMSCRPEDFLKDENVVVISKPNENARKYLTLPFFCNLATYGHNIVASVDERVAGFVSEYLEREFNLSESRFESLTIPRLQLLTEEFLKYGHIPCFMAVYFLPDVSVLTPLDCPYEVRLLSPPDFAALYEDEWRNALSQKRPHLDRLAVGAYDKGALIGLAGCSADCDTMWQIGVDVLPAYRRLGVAAALTSRLAIEVLSRGKVPFYCAMWTNIGSVRNAVKSGFRPAWVEVTAAAKEKAAAFMN